MNLFSELEALRGEQLATAGLRLLLLRSQGARNALVKLLNAKSPVGMVASRSHFSCYTEFATASEEHGSGRLDMVVELDSVVVGFEVKLAAEFQTKQPVKYWEELARLTEGLDVIRRGAMRPYMVVLAPESRRAEVSDHLASREVFLSWEEVLRAFRGADISDGFVAVLLEEFEDFLADHLHFLPRFEDWSPHLEGGWEPGGTDYQREFLRKLIGILPNPGGRIGSGDTWVGYYFRAPEAEERTWIGFVATERVTEALGGKAVLVASRDSPVDESGALQPIALEHEIWVDGRYVSTWRIPIDSQWSDPKDWFEVLEPLLAPHTGG